MSYLPTSAANNFHDDWGRNELTLSESERNNNSNDLLLRNESLQVFQSRDEDEERSSNQAVDAPVTPDTTKQFLRAAAASNNKEFDINDMMMSNIHDYNNMQSNEEDADMYSDLPDDSERMDDHNSMEARDIPQEFLRSNSHNNNNIMSSAHSVATATQTNNDDNDPNSGNSKMPMYLPTFKPATGCTNASDFVVRCFVARLRAGITIVKHGRSRFAKSRLRVLHIHPDGRSLTWKPAEGEPTTNKRPPKLDLSTCTEVRHAWSPDPMNPMYTGTPVLRQKCEAANAHKSFALIFKQRTVDITAVTADQCKVLMEGFSALCFRLQVAQLAKGKGNNSNNANSRHRPMPEDDGVSVTASNTLTNNSGNNNNNRTTATNR